LCNAAALPCIFLCEVFTDSKLTRRSLLSALSLYPAARLLSGQQDPKAQLPDSAPKYSADAKVVNVFATVRNKSGKIIKGLTRDDFVLDEEGRAQSIKFFSQESSLPLYLGLLVDTSGSQRRLIEVSLCWKCQNVRLFAPKEAIECSFKVKTPAARALLEMFKTYFPGIRTDEDPVQPESP